MVSFLVVTVVACLVSGLTLFAGFGLGTLLMPAFALFFPVEVAVAATAIVHGANGLFKVGLLWREAVGRIVLRFGLPAIGAAFLGALLLTRLAGGDPLLIWRFGERAVPVAAINLVMGILIVGFALFELVPRLRRLRAPPRWLPVGGLLSGFFGGLSGHQGALRAAFLTPLNLAPAAFAGTQAVIAVMVDVARLSVYGAALRAGTMAGVSTREEWMLVGAATAAAFLGAFGGKQLLPKVTVAGVRRLTGGLLLLVGMGLASGLI